MVFTNDGIEDLQTVGMRDGAADTPKYLSFAGANNTFTGTESVLGSEYIRKLVLWQSTGIQSKYLVELTSTEAIGSYIGALGLVGSDLIGSNTLHTIDQSFIGSKNDQFSVQVEGEVIIRRPV